MLAAVGFLFVCFCAVINSYNLFPTMFRSSKNGEFNLLISQKNHEQPHMKYSTDFGNDWVTLINKTEASHQWTSLSITQSNQFVLGSTSREAQELPVSFLFLDFGNGTVSQEVYKARKFRSSILAIASSEATNHIYVSSERNVLVSSDYGVSWNVSLVLEKSPAQDRSEVVQIETSDSGQYVYVLSYAPCCEETDDIEIVFVCVVRMSTDFGATWSVVKQDLTYYVQRNSLWVSADGQRVTLRTAADLVVYSDDFGKTFTNIVVNIFPVDSTAGSSSAIGDDDCDDDTKFTRLRRRLSDNSLSVEAVAMSRNGFHIVVAAASTTDLPRVLVYSRDGGQSWFKLTFPVKNGGDTVPTVSYVTVDDKGSRVIAVLADDIVNTIPIIVTL